MKRLKCLFLAASIMGNFPQKFICLCFVIPKNLCSRKNIGINTHTRRYRSTVNGIKNSSNLDEAAILFYNDIYEVPLPPKHRFPMGKYRLVREKLQNVVSSFQNSSNFAELYSDKKILFLPSPLASKDDLETTHCPRYIDRFFSNKLTEKENRQIGFPWSKASVLRTLSSTGGTIAAMHASLGNYSSYLTSKNLKVNKDEASTYMNSVLKQDDNIIIDSGEKLNVKVTGHIAGGTHHAFFDRGEGFCIFNDIAVAANVALRDYKDQIKQILIIDLDVHQGNGTSVLFQNRPEVFTYSIHCKGNYFSPKETSDLDVEMDVGTGDIEYFNKLDDTLHQVLTKVKPDLIFIQGGIDAYKLDRLGHMCLSRQGLMRRNHFVYQKISETLPNAKVVITMGGGYPKNLDEKSEPFQAIVNVHSDVYINAMQHFLFTNKKNI